MDFEQSVEFHPFGTVTFHFDEVDVKLRRCRLGDLQFGKDLLAELRDENLEERTGWANEIETLRQEFASLDPDQPIAAETRDSWVAKITRTNELAGLVTEARYGMVHGWLSKVLDRMGDNSAPPKEEWPLDFFDGQLPNQILEHWQTRPLAYGATRQTPTTRNGRASSVQPVPVPVSPQEPPPR